jgi:beta-lactamase class A
MCSTFKSMLAATVLSQAERTPRLLDRRVPVREADLLSRTGHPPPRRQGLTVRDLCRATMPPATTPANLLFGVVGGRRGHRVPAPAAMRSAAATGWSRNERLRRRRSARYHHAGGDGRTCSVVLGEVLQPASRQQLADWLIDNETGDACLRAGLGKRWRVGDKTGSNGEDARNDIAVLWPRGRRAWVLTAYPAGGAISYEQRPVLAR